MSFSRLEGNYSTRRSNCTCNQKAGSERVIKASSGKSRRTALRLVACISPSASPSHLVLRELPVSFEDYKYTLCGPQSSSFLLSLTRGIHSVLLAAGRLFTRSVDVVFRENVCNRCPLVFSLSPDSRTLNNGLSFRCSFIEFHSSLPFSLSLPFACAYTLWLKNTPTASGAGG